MQINDQPCTVTKRIYKTKKAMPKNSSGLVTLIPSCKNESHSLGRTHPTAEIQNKKIICVHHHILGVKWTPICYYREKGLSDPS